MGSELLADIEDFDYYNRDNLSEFITIMRLYPMATDASNMELLQKYRQGNKSAKDLLIKTNLRLIVSQAKRYTTHSYELLDVINEGVIGFINAIEAFDETKGLAKFSTFATTVIRNAISSALSNYDDDIRKPRDFMSKVREYYRIKQVFQEEGKELPTDEEFRQLLGVTVERFKLIKTNFQLNPSSLNEKIGEDEDSEITQFIAYEETGFDRVLDTMGDKKILLSIKLLLSQHNPFYYYIFYNRVFNQAEESREEIAKRFSISSSYVGKIERRCVQLLRDAMKQHGSIYNLELPRELQRNFEDVNVDPMNPELIIAYLFFRDILQDEERDILKLLITSIYSPSDSRFLAELGINQETYQKLYKSLMEKLTIQDSRTKAIYGEFRKNILNQYGAKIFSMDLDTELSNVMSGALCVANIWDSFTYEEVMEITKENNILLTPRMNQLLVSYFDGGREKFTLNSFAKRRAEREVNAILFGFHKKNEITITGLYDALINNQSHFTLNQFDYLMARKFHQDNLLDRGITKVTGLGDLRDLSRRLEKIHYGVSHYRKPNFTKDKYKVARRRCLKVLSSDKIRILDMYYGIKTSKYSISQIADELKISYEDAKSRLQEAKRCALRVYLGRNNTKIVEEKLYIPYVLDDSIDLSDETRTMLREFLIEKKSYEEIEAIHGIDKKKKNQQRKVASIIASGLLKIDCYRFGIFKTNSKYDSDECRELFKSLVFTEEESTVIGLKMDGKTKEEIMSETGLTFIRISYILNKFYRLCDEHKIASVMISESDIKREVLSHISEMVLNEKERLILAKLYGISCDVNPTGKRYTEQEFRLAHPEMSKQYKKYLKNALDTVRLKKAGLARASLAYMPREDLKLSLKDPRIPISQKDREILYYSFELEGYPYKTLKELEEIFQEKAGSLKGRVERIFTTIYKYENDEIPSSTSYEYDVVPYLKYFSKADQEVLKDLYEKKLTFEEIGSKHEITKGQVESLILSLDSYLKDLIEEEVSGYDFDDFSSTIDNLDIPFYGDKEKVKNIVYLYYEKRMSVSEIIQFLGLDCSRSVIIRAMSDLMIAVSKYKEGIRKVKIPEQSEIEAYYERNSSEMDLEHRAIYEHYFENIELARNQNTISKPTVPADIILDLISDQQENIFSFESTSRRDAMDIIKRHRELTNSTRYTILRAYHISQREFMSGSEKMKVLRFLVELDVKKKVLAIKKSA